MLNGCSSSWHWSSSVGRCIRNLLSSMLCGRMICRLPMVCTAWAGLWLEGCGQCTDRVPEAWQTRTPLGGSDTSRLHSWPHCLETPHHSKPSLPSFLLYGGQPPYGVPVRGPAWVTLLTGLQWSSSKQWSTGPRYGAPAWCSAVSQLCLLLASGWCTGRAQELMELGELVCPDLFFHLKWDGINTETVWRVLNVWFILGWLSSWQTHSFNWALFFRWEV